MQIDELMSKNVLSCRPNDSLARAAQLMWEGDVGAIPVTDDQDKIVGIITDRDVCMAAYTKGCTLADCEVQAVMSREVQTCAQTDSPALAEERMRKHQVRRLPVIESGRVVGMLSLNDIALAARGKRAIKESGLSFENVTTTLAGICEHRRESFAAA